MCNRTLLGHDRSSWTFGLILTEFAKPLFKSQGNKRDDERLSTHSLLLLHSITFSPFHTSISSLPPAPTTHGHTLYRPELFTTFNTHQQRTLDMVKTTMIARVSDGNWRQAEVFTEFGVEGTQQPPSPTHTHLHLCAPLRPRTLHLALPLAASIDDEQVHFNLHFSYSRTRVSVKYKSLPTKTDVEFACMHAPMVSLLGRDGVEGVQVAS